jgi:hypothetical protein
MKARIKVKMFDSGNYGVVTHSGFWSLVTDRDIRKHGGISGALTYYKQRKLNSLHRALSESIILN